MMLIKNLLKLLRISQWYKNVLIFVPLVFSLGLFDKELFLLTLLGFFSLSFMSSSYYILNDLHDIEKDKNHPEKKKRPLASGAVPKSLAVLLFLVLFMNSLCLAYFLSPAFLMIVLTLFLLSQIYNLILRDIAFLDTISISLNFVVRILAGSFLIDSLGDYRLLLSAFFLSTFMISGKRISETYVEELEKYRPCLNRQHRDTLTLMATVSVALTILTFTLYALELSNIILLATLPISFYLVLIYFNSVFHNPEKIRNPEKFILDKKIILALIIWVALLVVALYCPALQAIF